MYTSVVDKQWTLLMVCFFYNFIIGGFITHLYIIWIEFKIWHNIHTLYISLIIYIIYSYIVIINYIINSVSILNYVWRIR